MLWNSSSTSHLAASVDPLLVKKWIPGSSTHIRHFGKSYPFDVALAFNLTSKFSNPVNVLHNAGILAKMPSCHLPKRSVTRKL
jgi:hypothetical protein